MSARHRIACVFLVACATARPAPPAPPRHTTLGLRISELDMKNGLRVVVVTDPLAAQVQVTMRYRVGAVDDPAGKEGMAHLVEHLMFQQVVGERTVFARLQNDATYFNGFTSLDATTYVARAPLDKLDELMSFEGVRMALRCTSVDDAAFQRERAVVLDELRLRDEASVLGTDVRDAVYPEGHAYRRSEGGSLDSVSSIARADACAFADAHYTPSNAALVVSGPVEPAQVATALGKFLAHVPDRAAAPQPPAPVVAMAARQLTATLPIDDDALLVTWPLPANPAARAEMRAVARIAEILVDGAVSGRVVLTELGDTRAPMLALFVLPSTSETFEQARDATKRVLDLLPTAFAGESWATRFVFEVTKQQAMTNLFGTLEDGSGRDERLADYVLAGKNPTQALGAEMQGLHDMTRESAADTATRYLSFDRATVVTLKHGNTKKTGHEAALVAPPHDLGHRRDSIDPARAHEPAPGTLDVHGFAGVRTRTLGNGMRVVLMPLSSVPTVDVRVVFGSGTGDEAPGARGAALVAAYELGWSEHASEDVMLFLAAGGSFATEATFDHTTFEARGLDMHVDLLMTGVARLVRDGQYGSDAREVVEALRHHKKKSDDEGALTDAWRAARFGAQHPYVAAGLARHASSSLTVKDASDFRAAHFTPDNATIVIAGKFDPDLADKWVDYLFADWRGQAQVRGDRPAHPQPAAIARVEDTTQVGIELAIPATAGSAAERLVAAEMLDEIAGDVRRELGASYAIDASLTEARDASAYLLDGYVEVGRAHDAIDLISKRIAALHTDPDAAASAFVSARQRVLAHLLAMTGNASTLAEKVEHEVSLGREPTANIATARAVQALQIDTMAPVLADLDLARAQVLVRGPQDAIDQAFAVLGRTPTVVAPEAPQVAAAADEADDDALGPRAPVIRTTKDSRKTNVTFLVAPGYSFGQFANLDMRGVTVAADLGFDSSRYLSFGAHTAFGSLSGHYHDFVTDMDVSVIPISLEIFVRGTYDRYWGEAGIGLHTDLESSNNSAGAEGMGFSMMVQAGADILRFDQHRIGAFLRYDNQVAGESGFSAFTLGAAYRY